MYTIKKFQELTICDDFMFKQVMSHPRICKRIIERILHIKIRELKYLDMEKNYKNNYWSKGIRIDVYVEDEKGSRFILEMQMRKLPDKAMNRRPRYYQSTIDYDFLNAGKDYDELGDSVVIFFCPFSLFGGERRMYTFQNTCQEDKNIVLDDGTKKIFLCSTGKKTDDIDEDVNAFLDYMNGIINKNDFIQEIDDTIIESKHNEGMEADYMTFEMRLREEKKYAREEGREEGQKGERINNIKKLMKNMGIDAKKAMELLGIAKEEQAAYLPLL